MNVRDVVAAAGFFLAWPLCAQEIVLKVEHPLPTSSTAHRQVITPWCDKLTAASKGRLKCQIYPSMQLGGTSAQLIDHVKDGVVDVAWTIPSYSAGRFPLIEVFELPFMVNNAQAASKAVWDYVSLYAPNEFKDVQPLAFHVHGGGIFHMVNKPITRRADLRGLKIRAPTRQTTKLVAALGATPVGMPIPQVPEALAKNVIDGALLPYEVVPAIRANELTRFHSGPSASQPAIYTSVFILAMNKARYESLPADLRKIVDANSGRALSGEIGRIFAQAEETGRRVVPANTINQIADGEVEEWKKRAQPVINGWVADVTRKGADGKGLLDKARALIAKYGKEQ